MTWVQRFLSIWSLRFGIALLACSVSIFVEWQRPQAIDRLDEGLRDAFLRLVASERPESRLVVIDINESALRELGPWPWSRMQVADLVETLLGHYGARTVGLDIVFPESGDGQGDARLASLAAYGPLVLSQIFDYTRRDSPNVMGMLSGGVLALPPHAGVEAFGYIANHAGLSAARCTGNIGYLPDPDGVLRRLPDRTRFQGKNYPPLAKMMLACSADIGALTNQVGLSAPDNGGAMWRVPYTRALSAYTVVPASDILSERAERSMVAGRYVLVGSSALGLGDRVSTPLAPLSSGIMVHAASLSGLLDLSEGHIVAPWSGRGWLLAWTTLTLALAIGLLSRLSAWGGVLLLSGLVLSWLGLAFAGVAYQAEWSVTAPLWAYFFLLVVAVPFEWWQAQQKTRQVLKTFSHYVAQPVLDEIVRLKLQHSLLPTLCDVTVLIADMEGYTRATSSLSLDDAATLTKHVLACMTAPVLEWRGTLDKYTGDGLVAFWGAPLPCPDQADRAVSAALGILAKVEVFNAQRKGKGLPPVRVRIGIESGSALVGDLGTSFRSTYTAVGDCINFASRLEAAARDLPTELVIGATANSQMTRHPTVSLGEIKLRDTPTTIEVFTVKPM